MIAKLVNSELAITERLAKTERRAMLKCYVFANGSRILALKKIDLMPAILLTHVNSCQKPMPTWPAAEVIKGRADSGTRLTVRSTGSGDRKK